MPNEIAVGMIGVGGVLLGSILSFVSGALLQKWERKKAHAQRAWDLRWAAYSQVIGQLDHAVALIGFMSESFRKSGDKWGETPEALNAIKQMVEHAQAARAEIHASRLAMSEEFVQLYFQLNSAVESARSPYLTAAMTASALSAAVAKEYPPLLERAQIELDLRNV